MTPQAYKVGRLDVTPSDLEYDGDSRGILWMWEPPSQTAEYVVGVDPTVGITGWNRWLRKQDDIRTDNAAVEVIRCGNPDVQVAEYAAPIDPEELAAVVNAIGRMYGGRHEDQQALCIIEVYPGMGLVTQRELISRFGYTNLPSWRYEEQMLPRATKRIGWYSSRDTRKMLWSRGGRHIHQRKVFVQSQWLVEEMADCTPDNFLSATGRAGYGAHDDRVVAFLLALWAANEWSMNFEPTEKAQVDVVDAPDWQRTDCTLAQMESDWNDRFSSLLDD